MKVMHKVIVVTGAGSGMGRALVLSLVRKGSRVAAVDLNENTLQETADLAGRHQDKLSIHVVNVSDRNAVDTLPGEVINAHGVVDGLINNAGIIQPFVRLDNLQYDAIERVLNVNFYGVIYMTKAFLPQLQKRPVAHVVNISSMGGFVPVPGQAMYGASKAGVKLFTEGLYSELIETGVRVTVVFPGAIATNIAQNSGVPIPAAVAPGASESFPTTSAEDAAETIIHGMERDRFHVYIGKDAKVMGFLYRLNPRWATRFIFNRMKGLLPI